MPEALVRLESLGQSHWPENSLSPGNVFAGVRLGAGWAEKSTLLEIFFSAETFQNSPYSCLNVSFQID